MFSAVIFVLLPASLVPAQDQQPAEFQTSDQENLVIEESAFPAPPPPVPTDEELLAKFSAELAEVSAEELIAMAKHFQEENIDFIKVIVVAINGRGHCQWNALLVR